MSGRSRITFARPSERISCLDHRSSRRPIRLSRRGRAPQVGPAGHDAPRRVAPREFGREFVAHLPPCPEAGRKCRAPGEYRRRPTDANPLRSGRYRAGRRAGSRRPRSRGPGAPRASRRRPAQWPPPPDRAAVCRALRDEFEAAESADAILARSVDRVRPVASNLRSGGATWAEYGGTAQKLDTRVGARVRRGAPGLWDHLAPRIGACRARRT